MVDTAIICYILGFGWCLW